MSKEGLLKLATFTLASNGIGNSGPVIVRGEQTHDRFTALSIEAFGRTIVLTAPQLAKIEAGMVNGAQLSFENAIRTESGRTIYVVLSKGFTSGAQRRQCVTVNEMGSVEIGEVTN